MRMKFVPDEQSVSQDFVDQKRPFRFSVIRDCQGDLDKNTVYFYTGTSHLEVVCDKLEDIGRFVGAGFTTEKQARFEVSELKDPAEADKVLNLVRQLFEHWASEVPK